MRAFLESRAFAFDADGLRAFFHALGKGTDGCARKPLKPASLKHAHSLLSAFGAWCVEEGLLPASPMKRIPPPILRDEGIEPFSDEELRRILEAARHSRNAERDTALIAFLADTGIRASELAALRVMDVDLTARTAQVRHGKGGKSRMIAFGKETAQVIWRHLRKTAHEEDDPLFASERGGPMTRGALLQLCRRLGKTANVRNVHPHRFRHDCAVRLLRGGAHVFGVMSLLGHSRVQTTQVYVRLAEADVRRMHAIASPVDNLKRGRK